MSVRRISNRGGGRRRSGSIVKERRLVFRGRCGRRMECRRKGMIKVRGRWG